MNSNINNTDIFPSCKAQRQKFINCIQKSNESGKNSIKQSNNICKEQIEKFRECIRHISYKNIR
mgnify:CR=1 FL=1